MENAQKMRANNDNNWWKIHEACLLAVSAMKPVFQELLNANALEFNLNAFVNQFVIACLHESSKKTYFSMFQKIQILNIHI